MPWLKAIPWRLVGAVAGVLALLWVGYRVRASFLLEHQLDTAIADLKAERMQNAANVRAIAQDIAENERERGALVQRLDLVDAGVKDILLKLPDPSSFVQSKVVPGEPCPRAGLSSPFVELYNRPATEAGLTEAEAH
jgi:hypothetical protein